MSWVARGSILAVLAIGTAVAALGAEPAARLARVEQKLLEASAVTIEFQVSSEGAVTTSYRGTLWLAQGNRARLEAEGKFQEFAVDLRLVSDGTRMRILATGTETVVPTPAHLNEALVIGLVRMGILHNLALLSTSSLPDHAEGNVEAWVQAGSPAPTDEGQIAFDVMVGGEPSGRAVLELGPGKLPSRRIQTVSFDSGEMRVEETYGPVEVGEKPDAARFVWED